MIHSTPCLLQAVQYAPVWHSDAILYLLCCQCAFFDDVAHDLFLSAWSAASNLNKFGHEHKLAQRVEVMQSMKEPQ